MLSDDIYDVNRYIQNASHGAPVKESWQRIKTALAELGTTPNSDYAAALKLAVEYQSSLNGAHVSLAGFKWWCSEREKSGKNDEQTKYSGKEILKNGCKVLASNLREY